MSIELIKNDIQKVLQNDIVNRHSFFQLQHFVINGEPTVQSRMWQCIRELRKRYDAIEFIALDIEDAKDRIALADLEIQKLEITIEEWDKKAKENDYDKLAKINKQENEIKKRRQERKKRAAFKSLEQVQKTMQEQADEAKLFLKSFEALQQIEPLKEYDDPQTQREYWNARLSRDINMSLLLGGLPLNMETVKTALSMPDNSPIKQQLINIIDQLKANTECKKIEAVDRKKIEKKE